MKSESQSCLSALIIAAVALLVVRFILPGFWRVIVGLSSGLFVLGLIALLLVLIIGGFLTVKNYRENQRKERLKKYGHLTEIENLYHRITEKLRQNIVLNQVSPEELLNAEILMSEKFLEIRTELIRLQEFASVDKQRSVSEQVAQYRRKVEATTNPAARQVMQQNLDALEEKLRRMESAAEEIRHKEALADLIRTSLADVDENLRLEKPVTNLFPADLYRRFGLRFTETRSELPPLNEKSSEE